jgi:predicted metal-binding membrane protein
MIDAVTRTEALLRRERLIIIAGLAIIIALAWTYIISGGGTAMTAVSMTHWRLPLSMAMHAAPATWTLTYALVMITMWWTMMIAMMLPSAAPTVLLYAQVTRHAARQGQVNATVPAAVFVAGYLAVWLAFSILATGLEWLLERAGVIDGMMMGSVDAWLSGGLLIAAGLYQLSPLKGVCLDHCRAPAVYLSQHWRAGRSGAFLMGIGHGAYCLGCCWALMLLLFVGGVMNLLWIAGLTAVVLLEKLSPFGSRLAPWLGSGFLLGGTLVILLV